MEEKLLELLEEYIKFMAELKTAKENEFISPDDFSVKSFYHWLENVKLPQQDVPNL